MSHKRKGNAKRVLSILLAVVMAAVLLPANALSLTAYGDEADTGLCRHHPEHHPECGYSETQSCAYRCHICPVQELIDALPDGAAVTADNAETVKSQMNAIDEARAGLTADELGELDAARYTAVAETLNSLDSQTGADGQEDVGEQESTAEEALQDSGKNENSVASVTDNTGDITYYDTIEDAWMAANAGSSTDSPAIVTLLKDVTLSSTYKTKVLSVDSGRSINFRGENYTLKIEETPEANFNSFYGIYVSGSFTLESGKIDVTGKNFVRAICARGVSFTMNGGTVSAASTGTDRYRSGIYAIEIKDGCYAMLNGGTVSVQNVDIIDARALDIYDASVDICGSMRVICSGYSGSNLITGIYTWNGTVNIYGDAVISAEKIVDDGYAQGIHVPAGTVNVYGNAQVRASGGTNSTYGIGVGVNGGPGSIVNIYDNANVTAINTSSNTKEKMARGVLVNSNGTVNIYGNANVTAQSQYAYGVDVMATPAPGAANIYGSAVIIAKGSKEGQGVRILGGTAVTVSETPVIRGDTYGLNVYGSGYTGTAILSGGIFIGGTVSVRNGLIGGAVKDLLKEGCAYYKGEGVSSERMITDAAILDKSEMMDNRGYGIVTVGECSHIWGEWSDKGNGTHGHTCTVCGAEGAEAHIFADGVCTVCGAKQPAITSIVVTPEKSVVTYGEIVTLTADVVLADTDKTVTYQWYKADGSDGTPISGENGETLILSDLNAGGAYTYYCIATCSDESLASNMVTVEVNPKKITVKADDKTKTYKDADPVLTYSAEGMVDGDILNDITVMREDGEDAGTYAITVSQQTDANPNYDITFKEGRLTIEPVMAQLSWSNITFIYNGTKQCPTAVVTNVISGDSCPVTVSGGQVNAGSYTATAKLGNNNYKLPEEAGVTFVIAPKEITVTITPNGGTYAGRIIPAAAVLNGVEENDNVPVILTYTGTANDGTIADSTDAPTLAGTYTVTATINNSNYTLTGNNTAEFVVSKASAGLSVSAVAEKIYGDPDFVLEVTKSGDGQVTYTSDNNDTATVDEDGKVTLHHTGTAVLTVKVSETANYFGGEITVIFTIVRKAASLTVEKLTYNVTYGDEDFSIGYFNEGESKVIFTSTDEKVATVDENGKVHIMGAGNAVIEMDMAESSNYNAISRTVTVNVSPKSITVKADDKTKTYGEKDQPLTWKTDGLVGEDTLTGIILTRSEGENVGRYTITVSKKADADPNYDITYADGTLTIKARDIGDAEVKLGPALTANKKLQVQSIERVTVRNADGEEVEVTTYTVTGNQGTEPGTYTMTITGTGNFTGMITKTFVISVSGDNKGDNNESGSAAGNKPASKPANTTETAPKTGENGNLWLWFMLLFVSCSGMITTVFFGKKRKKKAE